MYILALNVNMSYKKYLDILKSLPFLKNAKDFFLYECVRSAWGVKKSYAKSCDYVVAVYKEKIKAVYKANAWLKGGDSDYFIKPIRPRDEKKLEFVGNVIKGTNLIKKKVPKCWLVDKSYVYIEVLDDLTFKPIKEDDVPIKSPATF